MKKKLLLLAIVGAVLLSASPVLADDSFYVIGEGGAPGTKISSLPYEITTPGFYYVSGNLSCPSGNGITVSTDDVTIDLMGFRLSGNGGGSGIIWYDHANIEIRNGTLRNWNSGIYGYSSFVAGSVSNRAINVRCQNNSVGISFGDNGIVRGCSIQGGTTGISGASLVANNAVYNCSLYGINTGSGTISGNTVTNSATGIRSNGGSVIGNTVYCSSGQTGIALSTSTSNPILMDQNTVNGGSTRYSGGSTATVWAGKSTDNPWGNNAGHQ
jgi:hypothetical protein